MQPDQARSAITFSVIVPCYNDADVLVRCLDSIGKQTYPASEIIVVDDGSDDETATVFDKFAASQTGPCFYHRQINSGVSSARNKGIDLAQSEYLVFIDADDELHTNALEEYQTLLSQSTNTKWLVANHRWERNGRVKSRVIELPSSKTGRFKQYLGKNLNLGNISNMCFAKDVFNGIQFPTELRFGEDTVVFAIMLTLFDPVVVDSVSAVAHRRNRSLRNRATLCDLIDSQVHSHLFKHPLLQQKYLRFAGLHWARNCRSIMRRAYREKEYALCVEWYSEMVSAHPQYRWDVRMFVRYMKAKRKVRTSTS